MYEYRNLLPIGLVYDVEQKTETIPEELTPFEAQNIFYQKLTNQKKELLQKVNVKAKSITRDSNNPDKKEVSYQIQVKGKAYLYFYMKEPEKDEDKINRIYVNRKLMNIPTLNTQQLVTKVF